MTSILSWKTSFYYSVCNGSVINFALETGFMLIINFFLEAEDWQAFAKENDDELVDSDERTVLIF